MFHEVEIRGVVGYDAPLQYRLDKESGRILARCIELFHVVNGNKSMVYIVAKLEMSKSGLELKGYIEAAEAIYNDPTNLILISEYKETYPILS